MSAFGVQVCTVKKLRLSVQDAVKMAFVPPLGLCSACHVTVVAMETGTVPPIRSAVTVPAVVLRASSPNVRNREETCFSVSLSLSLALSVSLSLSLCLCLRQCLSLCLSVCLSFSPPLSPPKHEGTCNW